MLEVEATAKAENPHGRHCRGDTGPSGVVNVIPARTIHSLDLRHPDAAVREKLRDHLQSRAREIAASRGCEDSWEVRQETNAVEVAPNLEALLEEAVQDAGLAVRWSRS